MTYGDDSARIHKIGDALSQLANVSWPFWPHRHTSANESTSGRCYREGRGIRHLIDAVFFWQRDPRHCERAYLSDLDRAERYIAAHDSREIM